MLDLGQNVCLSGILQFLRGFGIFFLENTELIPNPQYSVSAETEFVPHSVPAQSLLWTAAFTMVVVFVLHLPTTSMTNKVDMVRVWTGLGGTLDVGRIFNLLGRLLHATERKSSSAKNTIENDIFVSKNSSSYVYGASYSTEGYCKVYKHFNGMGLYDNG